ncbi:3-deoxy-manno-octulosonate cytidylyltransferase [Roseburia inulinivorans]
MENYSIYLSIIGNLDIAVKGKVMDEKQQLDVILIDEKGNEKKIQYKNIENLLIKIDEKAENCVVKLHKPIKFVSGSVLDIKGINTTIELETSRFPYNLRVLTSSSSNQSLYIGKNCSTWHDFYIHLTEDDASVYIGDDCMLSKEITIWGSDGHAIIDCEKNRVMNIEKKGVYIGNRVWVSAGVTFTKNAKVLDNSVIGTGSIVTKEFDETNILLAGNPAKIIKRNIKWYRGKPKQIQEDINKKEIKNKKVVTVIPARYQSSRFPGKPLAKILGKPMIQWVYERVSKVEAINEVYVATDSQEIFDVVTNFGGTAILTGECKCGTDRVYEAIKNINADIVLNIQGDEPLIKKEMIESIIAEFSDPDVNMVTLKKKITNVNDVNKANVVKVISDIHNDAIYFSRCPIPFDRDGNEGAEYYKHIGIYGYTKNFLNTFVNLKRSNLECMENLEQLRAIENGYKIRVVETQYESVGVDLPEHIALVEEAMKKEK